MPQLEKVLAQKRRPNTAINKLINKKKYIYMWNNSYRTLTEYWQKASDFQKDKKLPTYLGRAKEKRRKQRQKNRDGTCTSGREL